MAIVILIPVSSLNEFCKNMESPKTTISTSDFEDLYVELPEEDDEEFKPIPKSKYIPEYETEVERYMAITQSFPKNTILYEYAKQPEGLDSYGVTRWATEEIKRCVDGHNGLCGKEYFYLNFCYIQAVGKKIRPKFRVIDNEWFKLIEACQKSNEWGIICVKRRRVGASWKEACDMLHDCLFKRNQHIGMNSKTERDSFDLFRKVKFIYENLPAFLRVKLSSNTKSELHFSYYIKDSNGTKIKKGNECSIFAVAPTDNAYEGRQLSKWVADEGGKTKNLAVLFNYTEDCLMSETRRTGIPVIFGTAGDIGAEGKDLEYLWSNSNAFKLKRFFMSGFQGLHCDEYGNDDKESCIRWIVYKRHEKEKLRPEEYNSFLQRYPLTVAEAFTVTAAAGVGDLLKIRAQMHSLRETPAKSIKGFFRLANDERAEWIPSAQGKIIIYEHPEPGVDNLYIFGADPADHDDVSSEASDLSLFGLKRAKGLEPAKIVCEYTDRPKEVIEFFEQALLCSMYYNNAKILIERNRYLMIQHFKATGKTHLLARTPLGVAKITGGRADTVGYQMTPQAKDYLKGCIGKYVKDYCSWIPSYELLQEFLYFGAKNTDRAMAFGIALIMLDSYKTPPSTALDSLSTNPNFGFRSVNGEIKRVKYEKRPGILDNYKGAGLDLTAPLRPVEVKPRAPNRLAR
ncbi:MAG: hypothetical protein KGJ87_08820 [Planctomycetota bacterium]|nr:hypothetical protein [Planctomycetota bacterium]